MTPAARRIPSLGVQMRRMSSLRRLLHGQRIGCHCVDGAHLAYGPDRMLPDVLRWLRVVNHLAHRAGGVR
jgi:hypothetical protein